MRILIIGLGSMGRRHADILMKKGHEVYALRTGIGLGCTPEGVNEVRDFIDADIAYITNPTHLHISTAIQCAKRGMHLFIEKPIDVSTHRLDRLIEIVKEKKMVAYVAYPFRFHTGLDGLRSEIGGVEIVDIVCNTDYRKWQAYGVETHQRAHNGVLLELSHEIDIAQWFFGNITGIRGFFGDTTADLMLRCTLADNEIRVRLNMESPVEDRFIAIDGMIYPYTADGTMFEHQTDYFLSCCVRPSWLINKLEDAADMFRRLIRFREES